MDAADDDVAPGFYTYDHRLACAPDVHYNARLPKIILHVLTTTDGRSGTSGSSSIDDLVTSDNEAVIGRFPPASPSPPARPGQLDRRLFPTPGQQNGTEHQQQQQDQQQYIPWLLIVYPRRPDPSLSQCEEYGDDCPGAYVDG